MNSLRNIVETAHSIPTLTDKETGNEFIFVKAGVKGKYKKEWLKDIFL